VRSTRVLGTDDYDISGGDAIVADLGEFEQMPAPTESLRSIYWQLGALAAWRMVVAERPVGWRGDMYSVYLLPQSVDREDFVRHLGEQARPPRWAPVVDSSWRPPQVFRAVSGEYWFLHPGEPHDFLAPWSVYQILPSGPRHSCSIQFRPSVKAAVDLLPPQVRRLEALLDRTIGSGEGEGTLQQTAGLRLSVQQTWANVALRPWALAAPYNTQTEAELGLSAWAAASQDNRRLLAAIEAQTRVAKPALALHYERSFGRSPADARVAADFAIEVAIRSHYVFPASAGSEWAVRDTLGTNPWRPPAAIE
jgi:hypothetical protein